MPGKKQRTHQRDKQPIAQAKGSKSLAPGNQTESIPRQGHAQRQPKQSTHAMDCLLLWCKYDNGVPSMQAQTLALWLA
jgi:hypothetical protein